MNVSKFINNWEKIRKRGVILYTLAFAVLVPVAGLLGKVIVEYISMGILFRPFLIPDYIALIFLCFASILIGIYCWKYNEKSYKELMKNHNNSNKG